MTIEELKKLNEEIVAATLDYQAMRINLKSKEADLLLNTDFEKVLGKKRPTVGEKEAYILSQVKDEKLIVEKQSMNVEGLKRLFEIYKLEVKFNGEIVKDIIQGVELDESSETGEETSEWGTRIVEIVKEGYCV